MVQQTDTPPAPATTTEQEATLIILKPDALARGLVNEILGRIRATGLEISHMEMQTPSRGLVEQHYYEHRHEPFYQNLIDYMTDTVLVGIVEGPDAASRMRDLIGATEPASADSGTIRGDLGDDSYAEAAAEDRAVQNLIHASKDADNAEEELRLWFPDHDER